MIKARLNLTAMGQNIQRMRMERSWTQKALAEKAALSVSQLSLLERGRSGMSVMTFMKLCAALGCKPSDILKDVE